MGDTLTEIRARSLSSKYQHMIVMPTEKCNFRCTYCYEKFDIGQMKPNVVNSVKKFASKRIEEVSTFHLGWFGGEPLMAKKVLLDISDHCFNECQKNNVSFFGSITSNGFLLDEEYFSRLVATGIKEYQISIDGPKQLHNKTRILANGEGTFEQITKNIDSALKTDLDFKIILRVHFLDDTLDQILDFVDFINTNWMDERLVVHFAPIQKLGGENDDSLQVVKNNKKNEILDLLRSKLAKKEQAFVLNNPSTPYVCYASKMNSVVIRADGRISKCTVALYNDKNIVGRINDDGSLQLDTKKYKRWGVGLETGNVQEIACPSHTVLGS